MELWTVTVGCAGHREKNCFNGVQEIPCMPLLNRGMMLKQCGNLWFRNDFSW